MFLKTLWSFVQGHAALSIVIAVFALGLLSKLGSEIGFHFWYWVVLGVVWAITYAIGEPLYFWPFLMGMITAFAEIINKFDDEPMKALKSWPALWYHVLNGLIAVFALYLLALVAGKPANLEGLSDLDKVKYVMAAGFGAMLIMRSKLFNIKVGDDNVSFGPEQIITILFRFMESAIGRIRARARREFIEERLDNIRFDAVYDRSVMTLRRASRAVAADEMRKCLDDLQAVKTGLDGLAADHRTDAEVQLRSYELGYVIYDKMGEDFVADLFTNPRPEWLIRPPAPDAVKNAGVLPILKRVEADNLLIKAMPFFATREEIVPYMAYGTNMSSNRIRQRLNWMDPAGKESLEKTKPQVCKLKDFKLVFNRVSDAAPQVEGLANLESLTGAEIEGVLYQLPKTAMDFLEVNEPGYHRIKIRATVGADETDATVFIADSDCVGAEKPPNRADLTSMIEGAAEHGLSENYLKYLKTLDPAFMNQDAHEQSP
jgi:hypothetical protein